MNLAYLPKTFPGLAAVGVGLVLMGSTSRLTALSFNYVLDGALPAGLDSFSATLDGADLNNDGLIDGSSPNEITSLSLTAAGSVLGGSPVSWTLPGDTAGTPVFGLPLPAFELDSGNNIVSHNGGLRDSVTDNSILLRGFDDIQITDDTFSFTVLIDGRNAHWETAAVPETTNTLWLTGLGLMGLIVISRYAPDFCVGVRQRVGIVHTCNTSPLRRILRENAKK